MRTISEHSFILFLKVKLLLILQEDIDIALDEFSYPAELSHKLHDRRGRCLLSLGREEKAKEAFGEALKGLEDAKMKDSKKEETKKELEDVFKKVRRKNPELSSSHQKVLYMSRGDFFRFR